MAYRVKSLWAIVLILSIPCTLRASEIIYVDASSPNVPGTGSQEDPFRRIQDAIDSAGSGDKIIVTEGVYTDDANNRDLNFDGKSITVRSTEPNNPNIVANTVIDANGAGRVFHFDSGEDANCIVAGLTIKNGYPTTGAYGANVYCYNSSPTIRDCIIMGGYAGSGGGLYCDSSALKIVDCIITGNSAVNYGGGISCNDNSSPEIIGCTISGNGADEEGGGLDCVQSNPMLINCVISNNEASHGGGISCFLPGETRLVNCTITGNSVTNLGGGLYLRYECGVDVKNSILWANDANNIASGPQVALDTNSSISVSYCDVAGGQTAVYDPCNKLVWGSGNIDADPCFVSFDLAGDVNYWDLHLQSPYGRWDTNTQVWVHDVNMSRCIDRGDPNSDWVGEPWPNGKRINMGAYGGTAEASKNGNEGDFNVDRTVDFADFCQLAGRWMVEEGCIEDLSGNGVVEFADLAIFAENWLWHKE